MIETVKVMKDKKKCRWKERVTRQKEDWKGGVRAAGLFEVKDKGTLAEPWEG